MQNAYVAIANAVNVIDPRRQRRRMDADGMSQRMLTPVRCLDCGDELFRDPRHTQNILRWRWPGPYRNGVLICTVVVRQELEQFLSRSRVRQAIQRQS